jgi:hypothetical protein
VQCGLRKTNTALAEKSFRTNPLLTPGPAIHLNWYTVSFFIAGSENLSQKWSTLPAQIILADWIVSKYKPRLSEGTCGVTDTKQSGTCGGLRKLGSPVRILPEVRMSVFLSLVKVTVFCCAQLQSWAIPEKSGKKCSEKYRALYFQTGVGEALEGTGCTQWISSLWRQD